MSGRANKVHGHSFNDYYGLYESYIVNLVKESDPYKEAYAQELIEAKRIVEMFESNPDRESSDQLEVVAYHHYKDLLTTHGEDGRIKEFWELREPIYYMGMSKSLLSDSFVYRDPLFDKEAVEPQAIIRLKSQACYKTLEGSPEIQRAHSIYKALPYDNEEFTKILGKKSYTAMWNGTLDETGFICTIAAHLAHYLYDKEKRQELSQGNVDLSDYSKKIIGEKRNIKKGPVIETLELIEFGYGLKLDEENMMLKNLLQKLVAYAKNGKIPPYFTEAYANPIKRLILRIGSRYHKRSVRNKNDIRLMIKQIVIFVSEETDSANDDSIRQTVNRTMKILYDHINELATESVIQSHNDMAW